MKTKRNKLASLPAIPPQSISKSRSQTAAPPQPNPKNRRRSASVSRYLGNTQKTRKRKNKQIHMTQDKTLISNTIYRKNSARGRPPRARFAADRFRQNDLDSVQTRGQ